LVLLFARGEYKDVVDSTLTPEQLRERLRDAAADIPDLQLVVLFGSEARGRARKDSDIDVAVLTESPAELDSLYLALAPVFKTDRLDLVDLRRAGPVLAFSVARSGLLLFERSPGTFRQFQSLAYRRFGDTKKLRDAQRRSIHVFLSGRRQA
jgi:predicted nucleotidyltransferase